MLRILVDHRDGRSRNLAGRSRPAATNAVPECATPGRLMAYLAERNPKLDPRFAGIATAYMRHGEQLGLRWDYAFFQMILETGSLTYTRDGTKPGDVKPKQNNFAGLGATGNGEPGETFPSVDDGVKAHLQHLAMYSGERVEEPVAERTRKVQEWGVLTSWQKGFKRPITFADLAAKWAPGSRGYASNVELQRRDSTTAPARRPIPSRNWCRRPARAGTAHGDDRTADHSDRQPRPRTAQDRVPSSRGRRIERARERRRRQLARALAQRPSWRPSRMAARLRRRRASRS